MCWGCVWGSEGTTEGDSDGISEGVVVVLGRSLVLSSPVTGLLKDASIFPVLEIFSTELTSASTVTVLADVTSEAAIPTRTPPRSMTEVIELADWIPIPPAMAYLQVVMTDCSGIVAIFEMIG